MRARAVGAGAALALVAALFVFKASAKMPDFEVYWRAGERAAAGEPLYRAEDEHYQLKYLPAFAVLAVPAALVPLPIGKALWFGISTALLVALLALSVAMVPERRKPAWVLSVITLVVMAKFYGHELVLGQVNFLLAVLVLAGVRLTRRGRSAGSGLVLALAVVIKPYAVIFVPWLAARRDLRALAACVLGILIAFALPAAIYGVGGAIALHRDWWTTVRESTAPNLTNADNVSVAAMYAKWIGQGPGAARLALATSAVLLGAAAAAFAARRRVPEPDGLEAALLLTLIPLLSPQGWDYVFLVSTPAVVYLINYERELPRAGRAAVAIALGVIGLSVYDVMGRRLYGAFMALSIISVCYLVVIAALVALRLRRAA